MSDPKNITQDWFKQLRDKISPGKDEVRDMDNRTIEKQLGWNIEFEVVYYEDGKQRITTLRGRMIQLPGYEDIQFAVGGRLEAVEDESDSDVGRALPRVFEVSTGLTVSDGDFGTEGDAIRSAKKMLKKKGRDYFYHSLETSRNLVKRQCGRLLNENLTAN